MLSAVTFARWSGVAPGTTTVTFPGAAQPPRGLSKAEAARSRGYQWPPADGGPGVPPYPTQAWLVPEDRQSNSDRVRIALPPNQHVTSAAEMIVSVPNAQAAMGPYPNDNDLLHTFAYQPVHKSWIHTPAGDIFNLQGNRPAIRLQGLAENEGMKPHEKWMIAASVVGALAVATGTVIAVLQYRKGR